MGEITMNREQMTVIIIGLFAMWGTMEIITNSCDGNFNYIGKVIGIVMVSCWLLFYNFLIDSNEKKHDNLCKPYIGQTIMKKQLPDLLIFKDDKFLKTYSDEQQWFESKKIGDLFTKEDCKKIKWESFPY